jgi:hypothetical protein
MVFQSPGGWKFVQFLAVFTALVVKRNLMREQLELPLLTKTLPRHKELRLVVLKNMVELDSRACSTAGIHEFAEIKLVIFPISCVDKEGYTICCFEIFPTE